MNDFMSANLTKAPIAARTHVQNVSPSSATSSSSAKGSEKGGATMDFANRAQGFEVKEANHMQKATEAAMAEHQKTHEVNAERTKIPVFKKQDEVFIDDYPERRPKQSVHTAKRDDRRIRDRREPRFDTIDFSRGLMDILEKSGKQTVAVGKPQIYDKFSNTSNMHWGSGRFLDFFT